MSPADLLDFEARWPRHTGRKETAIIEQLDLAPARYYIELREAARSLEGQAHDAVTAHRVTRRADAYAFLRSARDLP